MQNKIDKIIYKGDKYMLKNYLTCSEKKELINYLQDKTKQNQIYHLSKKINEDPLKVIHELRNNVLKGEKIFPYKVEYCFFSMNRADELYEEYNGNLDGIYQEVINNGLSKTSKKLNRDYLGIKALLDIYGYDISVINKNKSKAISKSRTKDIHDKININELINIRADIHNKISAYEFNKKYKGLKGNRAFKRYIKLYRIDNMIDNNRSLQVKLSSERKEHEFNAKYAKFVINEIKSGKGIKQIYDENKDTIFNEYSKNHLKRTVYRIFPDYDSTIDTKYHFLKEYGYEATNCMDIPDIKNKVKKSMHNNIAKKREEKIKSIGYNDLDDMLNHVKQDLLFKQDFLFNNEAKNTYYKFIKGTEYELFNSYDKSNKVYKAIKSKPVFSKDVKKRIDKVVNNHKELLNDLNIDLLKTSNNKKKAEAIYYNSVVYEMYRKPKTMIELFKDKRYIDPKDAFKEIGGAGRETYSAISLIMHNNDLIDDKTYEEKFAMTHSEEEVKLMNKIKSLKDTFINYESVDDFIKDNNLESNRITRNLIIHYDENYHLQYKKLSSYEQKLKDDLFNNDILERRDYRTSDRKALNTKMEIDFYFPKQKLGIELDPTYTHNSSQDALFLSTTKTLKKSNKYHYNKFITSKEKGIKLLNLFEQDLTEPRYSSFTVPYILSLIKGNIKDISDSIKIIEIDKHDDATRRNDMEFVNKYDDLFAARSKYHYQVLYNNELVGVALFTNKKANGRDDAYMTRCAVIPKYNKYSIMKKLLNKFMEDHNYDEVYYESNNNLSEDNDLNKIRMKNIKDLGSTLTYRSISDANDILTGNVFSRVKSRLQIIKGHELSNDEVSEYILNDMPHKLDDKTGYVKVFDAGRSLYKYA